jgi:hypothetical protein
MFSRFLKVSWLCGLSLLAASCVPPPMWTGPAQPQPPPDPAQAAPAEDPQQPPTVEAAPDPSGGEGDAQGGPLADPPAAAPRQRIMARVDMRCFETQRKSYGYTLGTAPAIQFLNTCRNGATGDCVETRWFNEAGCVARVTKLLDHIAMDSELQDLAVACRTQELSCAVPQ